jgi:hypothetical protein
MIAPSRRSSRQQKRPYHLRAEDFMQVYRNLTCLLRFRHKNRERIVEPHDYGIHKGVIKLFGYQVAGSSSRKLPTWRWAEQDLMSDIQMLDRTFPGGRPTKSGKHHKWDKLFIRVKPSDIDQK